MPFCVETSRYWLGIFFFTLAFMSVHRFSVYVPTQEQCTELICDLFFAILSIAPTTEYITQAKIQRYHNSFATTPNLIGRASQQTALCCYFDYLVRLTNLFNTMWWNHRRVPDSTQHQDKIACVIEDNRCSDYLLINTQRLMYLSEDNPEYNNQARNPDNSLPFCHKEKLITRFELVTSSLPIMPKFAPAYCSFRLFLLWNLHEHWLYISDLL